jgi:hypothetical protein
MPAANRPGVIKCCGAECQLYHGTVEYSPPQIQLDCPD